MLKNGILGRNHEAIFTDNTVRDFHAYYCKHFHLQKDLIISNYCSIKLGLSNSE